MSYAAHKYFFPHHRDQQGYGGLGMFLGAAIIAAIAYFFIYPNTFPKIFVSNKENSQFCRPYLNSDGSVKDDAPTITAPSYDASEVRRGQPYPKINPNEMVPYRLIKSIVPLPSTDLINNFFVEDLHNKTPNEIHCGEYEFNGNKHSHFCQWIHEGLKMDPNFSGAYQYAVMYPAPYSDGNVTDRYIGATDPFNSEVGNDQVFRYGTYHVLFLLHLDEQNKPYTIATTDEGKVFLAFDVYQQVKADDHTKPVETVPDSVLKCIDGDSLNTPFTFQPVIEKSPDKKQEQLGWFVPKQSSLVKSWYSPACKPAINLYPKTDTLVNVKVDIPHGFLTYTNPLYPKGGWSVLAKPSGDLQYLNPTLNDSKGIVNYPTGIFPYLYYEGKINDQSITKPDKGFVEPYNQLSTFFDETLPKLGLNNKEATEFKSYWLKALPKSPYYFIGIIPQSSLDQNEPLTISPKQDTLIRVRLFFQQLDNPIVVTPPSIQTPARSGFTVVDWGAYVKNDKNHPFTCLQ